VTQVLAVRPSWIDDALPRPIRLPAAPVVDDPQFCLRHLAGDVVANRRAARQLWRGGAPVMLLNMRGRRQRRKSPRVLINCDAQIRRT
jgi:hypothetical protein